MRMDIACPVELMRMEQADFGEGRRQAYLTFLNESTYTITALSGRVSLLEGDEDAPNEWRVSFGSIAAQPGETFTCHLALDDFPQFGDATMLVEEVVFDGEEPWTLNPSRVRDYVPPALEEGASRNALIAIAGRDAVCYPAQTDNLWICVCGRYNRWRWATCRRCRRERDAVLALTPEHVGAAFEARMKEAKQQTPPRVLITGAPKPPRPLRTEEPPKPPRARPRRRESSGLRHHWVIIIVGALVTALLVWGAVSITRRFAGLPTGGEQQFGQPEVAVPMDYLEVL